MIIVIIIIVIVYIIWIHLRTIFLAIIYSNKHLHVLAVFQIYIDVVVVVVVGKRKLTLLYENFDTYIYTPLSLTFRYNSTPMRNFVSENLYMIYILRY